MDSLGLLYLHGKGVPQSDKMAVEWFTRSAKNGNQYGQRDLGHMYESGKGVIRDLKEAVHWYQMSADQGNVTAKGRLGAMRRADQP